MFSTTTHRRCLRRLFRFLFHLLTRVDAEGLDNLPPQGAYILVSNHLGLLDPVLLFVLLERDDATGFVAKKHQRNFFYRWIVNILQGIWLNRDEADTRAIRSAIKHLNAGCVLGIAPEGTRSPTKALLLAKTGAAYLVDMAKVPVVPACVYGTEKVWSEWLSLRRPHLTVRIGEQFYLASIERSDRAEGLKRNTDEIMCRIAALLPPHYWGVYAGHPRLKELLAS